MMNRFVAFLILMFSASIASAGNFMEVETMDLLSGRNTEVLIHQEENLDNHLLSTTFHSYSEYENSRFKALRVEIESVKNGVPYPFYWFIGNDGRFATSISCILNGNEEDVKSMRLLFDNHENSFLNKAAFYLVFNPSTGGFAMVSEPPGYDELRQYSMLFPWGVRVNKLRCVFELDQGVRAFTEIEFTHEKFRKHFPGFLFY